MSGVIVYPKRYQVIVIGSGHAGTEAALASARIGCQTLLLTSNLDTIAQMSCNPAIGGLAKGHMAREIDALGGEMGVNTDQTGIQFRMLNTKKGPSVRAPRAQCDKKAYQFRMKWVIETQPNLDVKQAMVEDLLVENGRIIGIITKIGMRYDADAIVITTGTFLRGLIHIGESQVEAGRAAEPASIGLSGSLTRLGFELGRLKTGTPPRLNRRSIDFSKLDWNCESSVLTENNESSEIFSLWNFQELFWQPQHPQITYYNAWLLITLNLSLYLRVIVCN